MWDLVGPGEAVCRDGMDAAISKDRRWQGVNAIKESAHQAADPAVGADGEGQEAHTGTEDGRDNLVARQRSASLFAGFTAMLELQFLTIMKTQVDFNFLRNLRIILVTNWGRACTTVTLMPSRDKGVRQLDSPSM